MWFRRTHKHKGKPHPEAEQALRDSKESLRKVKARDSEVHAVAEASRKFRRENHFADDLQRAFLGGHPT